MDKTLKELNVKPGDVVQNQKSLMNYTISENMNVGRIPVRDSVDKYKLISRATPEIDLTAITTPLGLLDDATRDALKAHGGPYRYWDFDAARWFDELGHPIWFDGNILSVKPSPKVESVAMVIEKDGAAWNGSSIWTSGSHKLTLTIQGDDIIGVTTEKLP